MRMIDIVKIYIELCYQLTGMRMVFVSLLAEGAHRMETHHLMTRHFL